MTRTGLRPKQDDAYRPSGVEIKLSDHPEMVDRIKYGTSTPTNPAIVLRQAVAALMELDELLVADGVQVMSEENPSFETSMTAAFIAGKSALLAYAARRRASCSRTGGYTLLDRPRRNRPVRAAHQDDPPGVA